MSKDVVNRISPLWLGFGISGSLLLILFTSETLLGRWEVLAAQGELNALARVSSGILRDLRIAFVHCLVIGYLPAAFVQAMRNGRRTVMELQELLDCSTEECRRLAASIRFGATGLFATAVVGASLACMTPYFVPPVPEQLWNPSTWSPEVVWHRVLGPLAMIWQFWLGYAIVIVSLRLSRIAGDLKRIDLLDAGRLAPFTRLGLQNTLLVVGSGSIWSLMLIETGFGAMMLFFTSFTIVVTLLSFIAPARGVHLRLRQSKEAELQWVNAEIHGLRAALQQESDVANGRMADLVAYRAMIEGISEWPFTTSNYTRFVLYAIIPLLSWGIGVVAENIVGQLLF